MAWEEILSSQLCFDFNLEYAIGKVQKKSGRNGIEWNTSSPGLCCLSSFIGRNVNTIQKNTEGLLEASKEVGPEVSTEKANYDIGLYLVTRMQDSRNLKTTKRLWKMWQS
jgi:hypothetical protein